MILLLALTHQQLADVYTPGLGRLLGPRLRGHPHLTVKAGWPWAADNDAYSAWNEDRYLRMLGAIAGLPGCLFVTAPDVVGDHHATLERFHRWQPIIRAHNLPVAFVAQDGVTPDTVPWADLDAVFIGGTTEFKLGPDAAQVARETKRRGVWLHVGRVNSLRRMRYCHQLGVDSIDGTNFARWNDSKLDMGKRWRHAAITQLHLELE